MDETSEESVELLLKLGGHAIQRRVPYAYKSIFEEAEKLFNDYYDRLMASSSMKADETTALSVLAFQFAIKVLEIRGSKADNVLGPAMEELLGEIEEALDKLER